jgi:hypothetical protein
LRLFSCFDSSLHKSDTSIDVKALTRDTQEVLINLLLGVGFLGR